MIKSESEGKIIRKDNEERNWENKKEERKNRIKKRT